MLGNSAVKMERHVPESCGTFNVCSGSRSCDLGSYARWLCANHNVDRACSCLHQAAESKPQMKFAEPVANRLRSHGIVSIGFQCLTRCMLPNRRMLSKLGVFLGCDGCDCAKRGERVDRESPRSLNQTVQSPGFRQLKKRNQGCDRTPTCAPYLTSGFGPLQPAVVKLPDAPPNMGVSCLECTLFRVCLDYAGKPKGRLRVQWAAVASRDTLQGLA